MFNYETIIGIEVHAELNTKHKIFSPSKNDINAEPNTNVHPIDLGLPGTLPRFNEEVLKKALIVANGFNMEVTKEMHWDRKNYFYPDNPKGYQITQQQTPIGRHGKITLDSGKVIKIDFMHMEEDTAKSFHSGNDTLLDFNRCGVPLLEIVSGPDMRSGAEAREYLEKLRDILLYLDASDCKMEEGSLRVDVNVSIRPIGFEGLNTKVEIKNLNSFNNVELAIEKEVVNQMYALNAGIEVVQSTKRFNESTKTVDTMRIKEGMSDYRYFPEPDLPRISLTDDYINNAVKDMPLLPETIKNKFIEIGLNEKEIKILMSDRLMTLFYLDTLGSGLDHRQTYNYLTANINEYLNKEKVEFKDVYFSIANLEDLANNLSAGKISSSHVKRIIPEILKNNKSVEQIINDLGLIQIVDESLIGNFVDQVISENPESIELHKSGKDRAFGFMVGQIMKVSKGQANPQLVNKILKGRLDNL
jgi:aspartyl-tRNA(Asn)/glutamyl-tRNA(Gln) amidotransferase subunit B